MGKHQRPHFRNINGQERVLGRGRAPIDDYASDIRDSNIGYAPSVPSSSPLDPQVSDILQNRMIGALLEVKHSPEFNSPRFNSVDIYPIKTKTYGDSFVRCDTAFGGIMAKDQDIVINEEVLIHKSYDYSRLLVHKGMYEIKHNDFRLYSPFEGGGVLANLATFGSGYVGLSWLVSIGASSSVLVIPFGLSILASQWIQAKRLQRRDKKNHEEALKALKGSVDKEKVIENLRNQKEGLITKVFPFLRSTCSIEEQVKLATEIL